MSISDNMHTLLNQQVTNELSAAHGYLAMSFSFESMELLKFAERFREQSAEERGHAMKIAKFLDDVGRTVALGPIPTPKVDFTSVQDIIETALQQEMTVTEQINHVADLARSENDHATWSFIQWFIDEQVEEIATAQRMLQLLKMAGDMSLLLLEERIVAETQGRDADD